MGLDFKFWFDLLFIPIMHAYRAILHNTHIPVFKISIISPFPPMMPISFSPQRIWYYTHLIISPPSSLSISSYYPLNRAYLTTHPSHFPHLPHAYTLIPLHHLSLHSTIQPISFTAFPTCTPFHAVHIHTYRGARSQAPDRQDRAYDWKWVQERCWPVTAEESSSKFP